ncbi:MAG: hypothetical protein NTW21_38030 [Verrucomicrobia bacterium]|nr:hypothetical protein [Verrucomicrobiota bacterium]
MADDSGTEYRAADGKQVVISGGLKLNLKWELFRDGIMQAFAYGQNEVYEKLDQTPGSKTDDYPADCVVEDCLLRGIGMVEKQAAGVQVSMASGIMVRHCSIDEAKSDGKTSRESPPACFVKPW